MTTNLMRDGYCIIEKALPKEFVEEAKAACYAAQTQFKEEIGLDRIKRAGEQGVVRAPMKYDRFFNKFLELPLLQDFVKLYLDEFAVMHLQNVFILPPENDPGAFQSRMHRDFKRELNGYRASINVFFALSDFSDQNGALRVIPGSQQMALDFSGPLSLTGSEVIECEPGTMIVFDSTLWHCAGVNRSREDRIAINHQFTRHWIKQQLDYPRLLGDDEILSLPPRTQRYLGYHARVPASLEEYYTAPGERLYKPNQG